MGVGLTVYAVDAAMAQRVRVFGTEEDPHPDPDRDPDELLEELEPEDALLWHSSMRTDKAWDVIHWMLTGTTTEHAEPFGARMTESQLDEGVLELDPAAVARLAPQLEAVDGATMRARIPATPDGVYQAGYRELTGSHDALVADAQDLVTLISRAAADGRWLVLALG